MQNNFYYRLSEIFQLEIIQNESNNIDSRIHIFEQSIDKFKDLDFLENNTGYIIPTRFQTNLFYSKDVLLSGVPCYLYNKNSNNIEFLTNIVKKFAAYYLIIDSYKLKTSISIFLNSETNLLSKPVLIQTRLQNKTINVINIKSGSIELGFIFKNSQLQKLFSELYQKIDIETSNFKIENGNYYLLKAKLDDQDFLFNEIAVKLRSKEDINQIVNSIHSSLEKEADKIYETEKDIFKASISNFNEDSLKTFIFLLLNVYFYSINSKLMFNYYIPSIVSRAHRSSDRKDSGYGTLVLSTKALLSQEAMNNIQLLTNCIWSRIALVDQEELNAELKINATRAAISQVMARNMSHNIGSHVLSKLITILQLMGILQPENKWQCQTDREFEFKNKVLIEELHNIIEKFKKECSKKVDCKAIEDCFYSINETLTKFEFQTFSNYTYLERFFSYLKARMDYLADVTTNTPVIEGTKGIYNDIVKPFIQNRILNDRISGIDEFGYEIIVCKPIHEKGIQLNSKDKPCKDSPTTECKVCKINGNNDITLSIPNDILGSHAFYTILENIIRNTAKHGNTTQEQNTEFKIKIEEAGIHKVYNTGYLYNEESKELDWNEFYAISIFDNCDLSSDALVDPGDYTGDDVIKVDKYKERKICEVQENGRGKIKIKKINKLVIDQNHILNKSILENNQLRHGGWGLIEMDASAAYLRKIAIELIDSDKYQITDLHGKNPVTLEGELAIFQAYAEQEKYLGYRHFIRKPQEILIVGDDEDLGSPTDNLKKNFKNEGVWIYDKELFKKFFADKKQKVLPHKLVLIVNPDETINKLIEDNKACFSRRIDFTKKIEFNNNIKVFIEKRWKMFLIDNNYKFYQNQTISIDGNTGVVDKNKILKNAIVEDHGTEYCSSAVGGNFVEIRISATYHYFQAEEPLISLRLASWAIPILVMDERMQSFAWKENHAVQKNKNKECPVIKKDGKCYHDTGVPYHIVYENTNVKVPDPIKECNLNAQNFNIQYQKDITEYTRIIKVIKDFIKNNKGSQYFMIIHLGILEKLIKIYNDKNSKQFDKDKKEKTAEFIQQEILGTENLSEFDNIVVTSGRGTPDNIPEGIRYLNFSVVSQYMVTLRNKFAFTEALFSARKTNKS